MPLPLVYRKFGHPTVEIKATWSDSWEEVSYLQVLRCSNQVPSMGLDFASLRYRYGRVKLPGDPSIEFVEPINLAGYWVRISVPTEYLEDGEPTGDPHVLFVGRIDSRVRTPHGKTIDNPASGIQELTAYGPYQILMKAGINSHFADIDGNAVEIRWVNGMNTWRGKGYDSLGNMSLDNFGTDPNAHRVFYGNGTDRRSWNSLEFARYLIGRYLPDPAGGSNPQWTIGGLTSAIESIREPVEFQETTNVAESLHAIIPRSLGVDWFLKPTDDGFEISVFSLASESSSYGDATLPANTSQFDIDATEFVDATVAIEETTAQRYRKIVVQGERMISCGSFEWEQFTAGWTTDGVGGETDYKSAFSDLPSDAEYNDHLRGSDQFRNVYQRFVVGQVGAGASVDLPTGYFPEIDASGGVAKYSPNIPFSVQHRDTLNWTPLIAGIDYSSLAPFDEVDFDPEIQPGDEALLPPAAYLNTNYRDGGDPFFASSDRLGIEVAALSDAWGLHVSASPPHLIAGTDFTSVNANPSTVKPLYTYRTMVITYAWQSDQRLQLVEIDDTADDLDGTFTITVPNAELWYVAPNTVYGCNPVDGSLLRTSEFGGLEVRNDIKRLERVMAGAIARYQADRYRATINVKGTAGWNQYLGYLIATINDGTEDTANIKSPITSINWNFDGTFSTQIRAGYA